MAVRSAHQPAPVLVEGIAEAIGCDDGSSAPASFPLIVDWPAVIATTRRQDVYGPGRQLVRYLILHRGIEPFLRYYEQAPDTRNPQVFAANFAAFWSTDLDTVWADMQGDQPAWGPSEVLPLCPCSLERLDRLGRPDARPFHSRSSLLDLAHAGRRHRRVGWKPRLGRHPRLPETRPRRHR